MCFEVTSLPEHEIILKDNVVKFHIIRNTKLDFIPKSSQKPTLQNRMNLTHQKNYLLAITHDPSFQKRYPNFDFSKALKNFETNITKTHRDMLSEPQWNQELQYLKTKKVQSDNIN